jgi:hypothetical protein
MWRKARGKEAEPEAKRLTHFEKAMGHGRSRLPAGNNPSAGGVGMGHRRALLDDDLEELWDFDAASPTERQFLNLKHNTAEFDDARAPFTGVGSVELGHVREKGSWWRRMYGRLSTHDREEGPSRDVAKVQVKVQQWQASVVSPADIAEEKVKVKGKNRDRQVKVVQVDLDSPPPPSLLGRPRLVGKKVDKKVEGLPLQSQSKPTPRAPVVPVDGYGRMLSPPLPAVPLKENSDDKVISSLERKLLLSPLSPPPVSPKSPRDTNVALRRADSMLARVFAGPMEYSSSEEEEPRNIHAVGSPKDKGKGRIVQKSPSRSFHTPVGTDEDAQASLVSPQASNSPIIAPREPSPEPAVPVPVPMPFQPTPIPHASLSKASRPAVLRLSDEQIERKAAAIPTRLVHAVEPALYPGLHNQTSQPRKRERIHDARPPEARGRDTETTPKFSSGPRRPQKIVLPTPLSPARYPEVDGGATARGSGFSNPTVDPREFGIGIPPQPQSQPPSQSQASVQARWPSTRNSRHFKYEPEPPRPLDRVPPSHIGSTLADPRVVPEFVPPRLVGAPPPMKHLQSGYGPLPPDAGFASGPPRGFNDRYRHSMSHPPPPQMRAYRDGAYRNMPSGYDYPAPAPRLSRREYDGRHNYSPPNVRPSRTSNLPVSGRHRSPPNIPTNSRRQSRLPVGLDSLESDLESLPRHPAVRPQVARMRWESFPNPSVPDERASRRISEPPQPHYTPRLASPTSPIASSPPLLSPLNDSRYPISGSRPTYFDKYDSSEFLTTLTTQSPTPPDDNPNVLPPILSTPGKKLKRK